MITIRPAALLALLLISPAAAAAEAPNLRAERGLAIARQWCAQCHKVEERQTAASDVAPTFASIAQQRDRTSPFVRAWLLNPHPPMPKLELSRSDVDELMAYIDSLRRPQR